MIPVYVFFTLSIITCPHTRGDDPITCLLYTSFGLRKIKDCYVEIDKPDSTADMVSAEHDPMAEFFASKDWQTFLDVLPSIPAETWDTFYSTVVATLFAPVSYTHL